ncbi:YihY/virulence factor BrkB family protein [Methylocystis heyeri]|uniref:YihY family inner membrane protein n=1 Tax=Methylocystis heyeri TaxID=391905 RepID=A0A6B8KHR0_9HYPH|nr:YihY/virulence factor BrkB family protein [Methylocystis heyeri]QGM47172.1 YihY family inner membrane protein [Methylocystis heyeri]
MNLASKRSSVASSPGRPAAEGAAPGPRLGWAGVARRTFDNIFDHRLLSIAGGVSFFALFALFPAIAALVAVYSLFSDPNTIAAHLQALSKVAPSGAISVVDEQLKRVAAQGSATLGFASIVGFLVSLWSANAATKAIFDALNVVYEERESRGFFRLNAISLVFTLLGIVFVSAAIAVMIGLPPLLSHLGAPDEIMKLVNISRWPLMLIVFCIAVAFLYRFGPDRTHARWRWISWGGAFAGIGWIIVSLLFTFYAEHFGRFNETYGSLGAVIGFMIWVWISNVVLLLGGEIDAVIERRPQQDHERQASRI